jgi:alpha-tubulin suppressor-like RCC1 family protein
LERFRTAPDSKTQSTKSLVFSDQGKVLACGDNKAGQTVGGAGTSVNKTPQLINYDGPPIVRIACGAEFSVILDVTGTVWWEPIEILFQIKN